PAFGRQLLLRKEGVAGKHDRRQGFAKTVPDMTQNLRLGVSCRPLFHLEGRLRVAQDLRLLLHELDRRIDDDIIEESSDDPPGGLLCPGIERRICEGKAIRPVINEVSTQETDFPDQLVKFVALLPPFSPMS